MKTIEVCKRSSMGEGFHASLQGHIEIWGAGKSVSEAVGDLIRHHPIEFELVFDHRPDETR